MSRVLLGGALVPLLTVACASSEPAPLGRPPSQTVVATTVNTPAGDIWVERVRDDPARSVIVHAPLAEIWGVLSPAFDAVGIEPNTVVSAQHLMGVSKLRLHGRLGGKWLSTYLNCGVGATGRDHADEYTVSLTLLVHLAPHEGNTTVLRHELTASAMPGNVSGGPVACGTRGQLEARLLDEVVARLKKTGGQHP